MENNRKITIIFWLLTSLVLLEVIEKGYQVSTWFQRRFVESGNSLRYSK
jgi:hypothetical protein